LSPAAPAPFAPTAYAAALLQVLRAQAPTLRLDDVLELGVGSGVVLAQLLELGARRALGVDIEPAAVQATRALLAGLGHGERAELRQGDLWAPCAGRRFDLIACNPPQFPLQAPLADGRLPSWSSGGADGRALIEPFLQGLPAHLKPGGRAFMTHNAFVGLARTEQQLAALGLRSRVASTVCLPLPLSKLQGLDPALLQDPSRQGLSRLGPHAFAEFHVLDIGPA